MSAIARRRLVAGGLLACVVAAVAVIVLGAGGSSAPSKPSGTTGHTSGGGAARRFPPSWRPYRGPVPILEYHAIQPPVPGATYPELFVPQADFTKQMDWLKAHGYDAVTLDQVEQAWAGAGKLPPKPVVITFDDGYRSQYVAAFTVLKSMHWPGVIDLIASGSDLPDADVRKMIDGGWELASHTIHHLDLTTLDTSQLQTEIAGSRASLERRFGVKVDNFCYPAGHYDQAAIAQLRAAGYRGATTELPGLADRSNPYTLARLEIELSDGLSGFIGKLRSAAPQGAAPPSA